MNINGANEIARDPTTDLSEQKSKNHHQLRALVEPSAENRWLSAGWKAIRSRPNIQKGNDVSRILPSLVGLEAFEATARLGSVSRAAEELSLTQSAVSRHLISLESRLGVALFSRRAKRLHLTQGGSAYLGEVRASLEGLHTATASLMASRGHTGTLSVATLPTFGANWLMPRLPQFRALHPGISLILTGRPEPFDFAFERVDCAIHFGGPEWPGAHAEYLCKETITAVASPTIAARIQTSADLLDVPLLQISSRSFAWRDWLQSVAALALPIKPEITVDTFAMAIEAVRAELAVAVLPTFLIEADLVSGRLATVLGAGVVSPSAYYFVRPERNRNHFAVQAFGAWLQSEVAEERLRGGTTSPATDT
jgi:LysR family glycine cleavage system transcriptional activator